MKPKRAVLYARVSRDDTGQDRRNLIGQLDMCREYAQQKGYAIVAELAEDDRGASGVEIDLPQLNRAREMARAKEFDVLVAREIDRLSRNLAKQLIVEDELKRYKVVIEYALGEYPDTPEGNLLKHVRASIAEFERLKIIERNARGRRQKVKAGSVLVAQHPPYGYDLIQLPDKKFVLKINEREAEVVRLVFTWYTGDQPIPLRTITRRLSNLGMPLPRSSIRRRKPDSPWSYASVRFLLNNETYAGVWHYGKTKRGQINAPSNWITVAVPPIVERATWEMAQVQLRRNQELAKRNVKHDYLMYHRLRCGNCNSNMACRADKAGGKTYKYYRCPKKSCPDRSYNVARLDEVIWEWVRSLVLNPQKLERGSAKYVAEKEREAEPLRAQLKIAEDLIAEHRGQLARLLDLYLSNEFEKDMLVERKERLEATIKALEVERAGLLANLASLTLVPGYAQSVEAFSAEVLAALEKGEQDFSARSQLISLLDVTGQLRNENGEKVVYARCALSPKALPISTNATYGNYLCRNRRPSHPAPTAIDLLHARHQSR